MPKRVVLPTAGSQVCSVFHYRDVNQIYIQGRMIFSSKLQSTTCNHRSRYFDDSDDIKLVDLDPYYVDYHFYSISFDQHEAQVTTTDMDACMRTPVRFTQPSDGRPIGYCQAINKELPASCLPIHTCVATYAIIGFRQNQGRFCETPLEQKVERFWIEVRYESVPETCSQHPYATQFYKTLSRHHIMSLAMFDVHSNQHTQLGVPTLTEDN